MSSVYIKFLILELFEVLGNTYYISLAIVFGTVFFGTFLQIMETFFLTIFFQNFIFMFFIYP